MEGSCPSGIPPEALTGDHDSVTRNPILAEVFYRVGLIEKWGRGTNRVVAQCRQAGTALPEFREAGGSVVVTFQVEVRSTTEQVTPQVAAILKAAQKPRSREELQQITGLKDRGHFRTSYLEPLLSAGWLAMTIPDKPNSRLQRYRTTPAGLEALKRENL